MSSPTRITHDITLPLEPHDSGLRMYGREYFTLKKLDLQPISKRDDILEKDVYINLDEQQQQQQLFKENGKY